MKHTKKLLGLFAVAFLLISLSGFGSAWYSTFDYRRSTDNAGDSNLIYPFTAEDTDGDGQTSTYYGLGGNSYIYYNNDGDFNFADDTDSQVFGASTFIDGSKNQQITGSAPSGLVAYYPLDNDNAKDISGNGNDGTLNGGVTTGATGQVDGAYDFDGSGDYVNIPHDSSLQIESGFTFCQWVKYDSTGTKEYSLGKGSQGNSMWGIRKNDDDTFTLLAKDDTTGWIGVTSTQTASSGTWYHLCGIYTGSEMIGYIDGSSVGTTTSDGTILSTTNDLMIGARRWSSKPQDPLDGQVDDIRIYDRALSSSEIQAIYDSTSGASDPTFGAEETENAAPSISINKPTNSTYWTNDINFNVSTSDPEGNNYDCNISVDSSLIGETNQSQESFTSTESLGVGNHDIKVECEDSEGASSSESKFFSIEDYKILNYSSVNSTFETYEEDYSLGIKAGDMINFINSSLHWNSSYINHSYKDASGIENKSFELSKVIPLIPENNSRYNWSFSIKINRSNNDGTYSILSDSVNNSQNVSWSYWLTESYVEPSKYIEREDYNFYANISTKTKKADLSGSDLYYRTDQYSSMEEIQNSSSWTLFYNSQDVGNVSSSSESYNISGNLTVSFNGKNREITLPNSSISLHKIMLTNCSAASPSQEAALNFTTYDETDFDKTVNSDFEIAAEVWKTGEITRTYSFGYENSTFHEVCIYPAWANYTLDTSKKRIEFQGAGSDYKLRSYFLIDQPISNETTNIPLYLLPSSAATEVKFDISDCSGEPYEGIISKIERYYTSTDNHVAVAMIRTGSQGTSTTYLQLNEIYYQFKFFEDKELIETKDDQIISDSPVYFDVCPEELKDWLYYRENIKASCSLEGDYFKCSYSAPEEIEEMRLDIKEEEAMGLEDYCYKTESTNTGELACKVNTSKSLYKYNFEVLMNSGEVYNLDSGWLGSAEAFYGLEGLVFTFMIFILLSFVGIAWRPDVSIILGIVALLASSVTNIFAITPAALMSIVLVGAVMLWRMSS